MTSTSQRFSLALALLSASALFVACGKSDTGSETNPTSGDDSSTSDLSTEETTTPSTSDTTSSESTHSSSSGTTTSSGSGSSSSDASSSNSQDSSDSDTTSGGDLCQSGYRCVDKPADGWEGPVARIEVESDDGVTEVGTCRAPYSFHDDYAYDKPTALPQSCQCTCGKGTGVTCSDAELAFSGLGDNDCSSVVSSQAVGTCAALADEGTAAEYIRIKAPEPKADTGSCPPVGPTLNTTDEPKWTLGQRTCRPFEPTACVGDAGLCVPTPPKETYETGVCIWSEGEQTCPDGDYSQRIVRYRAIDDQRGCGACTCSKPSTTGLTCKARVELFLGDACSGPQKETVTTFGECTKLFANDGKVPASAQTIVASVLGNATCTAGGGALTGGPVPQNPVTYCCTPD